MVKEPIRALHETLTAGERGREDGKREREGGREGERETTNHLEELIRALVEVHARWREGGAERDSGRGSEGDGGAERGRKEEGGREGERPQTILSIARGREKVMKKG